MNYPTKTTKRTARKIQKEIDICINTIKFLSANNNAISTIESYKKIITGLQNELTLISK